MIKMTRTSIDETGKTIDTCEVLKTISIEQDIQSTIMLDAHLKEEEIPTVEFIQEVIDHRMGFQIVSKNMTYEYDGATGKFTTTYRPDDTHYIRHIYEYSYKTA